MRLEGKVAIITGRARGQGVAEARLFAREGAKVVFGDILDDEGSHVEGEISRAGHEAVYVHLDVTSEDDWRRAVDLAVARFGGLHVLVNNAGIWRKGVVEETSVEETSEENWDAIMSVNVTGAFLGTRLAIPEMRKTGGGSIINISSAAGLVGDFRSAPYGASKGAIRLLTKVTAIQYGKEGIRANSIHPGPIDAPMYYEVRPDVEGREAGLARTPMGRMGTVDEIAYGALYLASDESSFVTGIELAIDGGMTAQ